MEGLGLAGRKQVSSKLLVMGTGKNVGILQEIVPSSVSRPHPRAE